MKTSRTVVGALFVGLAVTAAFANSGCAVLADDSEPDEQEDVAAADEALRINDIFKDLGKDVKDDVCRVLKTTGKITDELVKSGVFYGHTKELNAAGLTFFRGGDSTWDLRHHQFVVSKYKGNGFATEILSVGAEVYAGVAVGFESGVWDWEGWFVESETSVSLPFLKQFLQGTVTGFVGAVDKNKNNRITPDEILKPPNGVYGVAGAVAVGVGVPIDPLPASVNLTEGLWVSNKKATREKFDAMRRKGVNARLIDHEGHACRAGWPSGESEHDECAVEIGDRGDSHTKRGKETAKAMCAALNCSLPFGRDLASVAIQHGVMSDLHGKKVRGWLFANKFCK